mgnify:CR=1 FL=1
MNKWILIAVGVLVVIGVGAWVLWGRTGAGQSATVVESQTQSGSIAQLMAQGTSKCEVTSETDGVSSSGTVYVADGKVRGTFTTSGAGVGTVESNMIVRDGFVYVWSDAMPQGIKMSAEASGGAQTGASQPNPYDANYDYNCTRWSPVESQFALPSDITFTEFSVPTAGATGATGATGAAGASGVSCAQCDLAPAGSAREQCRAALNCK